MNGNSQHMYMYIHSNSILYLVESVEEAAHRQVFIHKGSQILFNTVSHQINEIGMPVSEETMLYQVNKTSLNTQLI